MKKNRPRQLPKGAVPGDPSRQVFCCQRPHTYYLDEERTCVQCGETFPFSAKEQKFWYETLHFHLSSRAIRCVRCRKQRRTIFALGNQIGAARARLKSHVHDTATWLELASAVTQLFERTGSADLNEAISAARKAREQSPRACEALFWEGKCQRFAGRTAKARACFTSFLADARKVHRLAKLVAEAERELAALR